MTTATRTRKPATKPERRVRIYDGVPALLEMTIGQDTFSYWLESIPADFGIGFEVKKMLTDGGDVYHVNIDLQRGYHTCTCKGGTYSGHCKHQEACLALIKSGKLPSPQSKPGPAEEPPQPAHPLICPRCGCPDREHISGFCPA